MRWEERLLQEFDDLEQQAEGLHLAERDAVVAELSVSTYAEVDLLSRLHASVGCDLQLSLVGAAGAAGVVTRVGSDWLLLGLNRAETLVATAAILRVRGASERAITVEARSVGARLDLGSALRQLAAEREAVAVTMRDGTVVRGQLRRVGADFVELGAEGGQAELVALDGLVMLRRLLA